MSNCHHIGLRALTCLEHALGVKLFWSVNLVYY